MEKDLNKQYLNNEWFNIKQIQSFLNLSNMIKDNEFAEIYNYEDKAISILKCKANIVDAVVWQENSNNLATYTLPIENLIINNNYCCGYITSQEEGLNGHQMLAKLAKLEHRQVVAKYLVDMYRNLDNNNYAYTNWDLADLLVVRSQNIKLINPHFFISTLDYPLKSQAMVDYNFCIVIFSILYGIDFSLVNLEDIVDLNIPENMQIVLNKKKNEILTLEDLEVLIKQIKKEDVYLPQIIKLIKKINN